MQYRSFNLTNKFLVIVTTCKGYIDEFIYDTNHTVFDNDEFDMISTLITMIQDIKDSYIELAKEYIRKCLNSSSSYEYKQSKGQAQEDMDHNHPAYKFYKKWNILHCRTLTIPEWNEMYNDVIELEHYCMDNK